MSTYHGKFRKNTPDSEDAERLVPLELQDAPVVLNPEAIGDPDATPVVVLETQEDDQ